MRGRYRFLWFGAALALLTTAAQGRPLGPHEELNQAGCPTAAVCGTVMRPLDPEGRLAGQLAIAYRLYPHTGPTKDGVIVAQEGGPGYTTTGSAFSYLKLFEPMRDRYDILMVNARGTGATAIPCPTLDSHPVRTPGDAGECGRSLGRASVLYGTRLAVQDMKAVLDFLHIDKINLYGDSYGTFFSQTFTALYPGMLRSVVLDGAYPVIGQSPWYPENAAVVKHGFNAVCERTPACAALPGTSLDRIHRLVQFVRAGAITGTAPDAEGVMRNVTIDPAAIGGWMFGGSGPVIYRDLDAAVRAFFDTGMKEPLLRLAAENDASEDPQAPADFSYGLFAAVSCMDYQQIYDMQTPIDARISQEAAAIAQRRAHQTDTYFPLQITEFQKVALDVSVLDLCLKWPVNDPPYKPGHPIPPNTPMTTAPTLVINGELDTLTAPGGGNIVASQYPNATHVIVANSFHVDAIYDLDDCAQQIVRRFILTLDAGDTSCAANIKQVRAVPFFPKRAADATPAEPKSGNTARTRDLALASAAVQTAGDMIQRWWINYTGHGRGLHGGQWSYTGHAFVPEFTMTNVQWVKDLAVSGTARWDGTTGAVQCTLTYVNGDGETANLTAQWNDRDQVAVAELSGTVADRTIKATMPAP